MCYNKPTNNLEGIFMDKEILKKSLLPGIATGLGVVLIVTLIRMLLRKVSFTDHILSPYGIASLICFPIVGVVSFYSDFKKKQKK